MCEQHADQRLPWQCVETIWPQHRIKATSLRSSLFGSSRSPLLPFPLSTIPVLCGCRRPGSGLYCDCEGCWRSRGFRPACSVPASASPISVSLMAAPGFIPDLIVAQRRGTLTIGFLACHSVPGPRLGPVDTHVGTGTLTRRWRRPLAVFAKARIPAIGPRSCGPLTVERQYCGFAACI